MDGRLLPSLGMDLSIFTICQSGATFVEMLTVMMPPVQMLASANGLSDRNAIAAVHATATPSVQRAMMSTEYAVPDPSSRAMALACLVAGSWSSSLSLARAASAAMVAARRFRITRDAKSTRAHRHNTIGSDQCKLHHGARRTPQGAAGETCKRDIHAQRESYTRQWRSR